MEWLAFDNGYANVCQFRCAYNAVERCRWWQRLRKSAISHAVLLAANYRSLFIDLSRFSKDSGGFFQKILTVSFVFSLSLSLSMKILLDSWRRGKTLVPVLTRFPISFTSKNLKCSPSWHQICLPISDL